MLVLKRKEQENQDGNDHKHLFRSILRIDICFQKQDTQKAIVSDTKVSRTMVTLYIDEDRRREKSVEISTLRVHGVVVQGSASCSLHSVFPPA